ncbi:4-(cytidine 5'-diphospho)-2-C-methyl-D-erythritol kinase [Cephaloticoccus primus]|nr:4-(cytidine 5'-diphospho)-2-C-methyl-D-erythritol kinase [Cephaloticoccus primus]
MTRLTLHAPAKVNLFLAITGQRSDGFHDLVSLAVPLDWGDELELRVLAEGAGRAGGAGAQSGETRLRCEASTPACEVPASADNLVQRAAAAFRAATGFSRPVDFILKKRVPVGAGLGGGSSDAVAALRGLNALAAAENPRCALSEAALGELAAQLGADCTFFVHGRPAIMRGSGERVKPLNRSASATATADSGAVSASAASAFLRGQRLFLCKPAFGVNTAWAYGEMRERARAAGLASGSVYLAEEEAEALCERWRRAIGEGASDVRMLGALTFNNMEPVVFAKYPALPVLATEFRERFGLTLRMSGSGSACFAFLPAYADKPVAGAAAPSGALAAERALVEKLTDCVHALWGPTAFTRVVEIAGA